MEDIIRQRGAVPATVAILKGQPHVGLTDAQLESLAKAGPGARKCSRRDLAVAIAQVGIWLLDGHQANVCSHFDVYRSCFPLKRLLSAFRFLFFFSVAVHA